MNKTLNQHDDQEISGLLTGRRITAAEIGHFEPPGRPGDDGPTGRLTLDDGTVILVTPNQGGCSCSAGDYDLTSLATCDNVITSVRLADESDGDEDCEPDRSYRIYVIADAVEINAVQIDGNDGNGYYGTGYNLTVVYPCEAPSPYSTLKCRRARAHSGPHQGGNSSWYNMADQQETP